jgi:hypothetical protein
MGSPHKENIQMATRMQQRRGTAAQWTAANPILAAGEIGFETDTSKFKMGNGSSTWSALTYFANAAELAAIVDGAPDLLNTLNELAAAIGDDPGFLTNYATITATTAAIAESRSDAATDATAKANAAMAAAALDATGKAATAKAEAIAEAGTNAATGVANHQADTTDVHGIPNTALLATKEYADDAQAAAEQHADDAIAAAVLALTPETIGLENVDNTTDANKPVSTAQATAISGAVSDHNAETENVHGIADTAELVTQTQLTNAISGAEVDQSALAGVGLEWNAGTDQFDIESTHITTSTQSALDLKAPLADPTFTGTVSGVTKAHVGLGNVDNTADSEKPVSTAQATAIATAKSEAIADATAQVNAVIASAPAALNTLDELAAALGDDANFATTVTNGLAAKAPINAPTFTGLVTVAASGVAFTDGTQTKVGVPSITTFGSSFAATGTLAAGEQDKFVPVAGAVTITLPATGYSTGQSIDFYQASGTGAQFASTNSVVGTPGLKFRTTNSVVTAMKTAAGWLVFGDLSA